MRGFRFWMHVLPLAASLGTWALASAFDLLREGQRGLREISLAAVAAAILLSNLRLEREFSLGSQGSLRDLSSGMGFFAIRSVPPGPHFTVARWLSRNLPKDGVVALSEAGIIPFDSKLPVLDYLGLNDRRVADFIHAGRGDKEIAEYVLRQRPTAIVMTGQAAPDSGPFVGRLSVDLAIQSNPLFNESYRLAHVVPLDIQLG